MNTAWIQFLHAQPPARSELKPNETGWLVLPQRASIRVAGDEAADFLQAMLTQDILALSPAQATRSALCNAKGRILSLLMVHPEQTPHGLAFHLTVPQDLRADLFKILKLYVLRRKVTLTLDDDWGYIGLINPTNSLCEALAIGHQPPAPQQQIALLGGLIASGEHQAGNPRLSIQGPLTALAVIAERITPLIPTPVAQAVWDCAEIHDGLPEIHRATYLQFVPQWINLDHLSAVSFKKGCYPGQEVIARLHYLGKSNRRMIMGHTPHPQLLPAGTLIYLANQPDTEVGEIVRSAWCESGEFSAQQFLAVIRLNHAHDALIVEQHPCVLYPSPFIELPPAQTH
ncbi:MAG: folate-binding protein YgfZ [Halothiobacillaceae bacterium]|nr:folate-binding protein YgfZ [Halothiobacillaceae bacterium]